MFVQELAYLFQKIIYYIIIIYLIKYINQHDIINVKKRMISDEVLNSMNSVEIFRFDFMNELTNDLSFYAFMISSWSTL